MCLCLLGEGGGCFVGREFKVLIGDNFVMAVTYTQL